MFVDPYEEADAQVRRVWPLHGEGLRGVPPSLRGSGTATALLYHQIAEERKKTQLEETAPESTVKKSQPKPGSQGPPTYRQGVGKYISPVAT